EVGAEGVGTGLNCEIHQRRKRQRERLSRAVLVARGHDLVDRQRQVGREAESRIKQIQVEVVELAAIGTAALYPIYNRRIVHDDGERLSLGAAERRHQAEDLRARFLGGGPVALGEVGGAAKRDDLAGLIRVGFGGQRILVRFREQV